MSFNKYTKQTWKGSVLTSPVPPTLVTCEHNGVSNVFTVAWTGILCTQPPVTYISVRPERYSYELISQSGEFVINLATEELTKAVDICGVKSGRKLDKFGIFRCERRHKGFCLPHENAPSYEHESARVNEGELECFLDAVVESCAVVVADNRLCAVNESEKRQNDNRNDAVGDSECRNCHVATRKRASCLDADVSVSG